MKDWKSRFPVVNQSAVNTKVMDYMDILDDEFVDRDQMAPPQAPPLITSDIGTSHSSSNKEAVSQRSSIEYLSTQSTDSANVIITQPTSSPKVQSITRK